jgi:hypothetical protein
VTGSGSARHWAFFLFVSVALSLLPSKAHSQQIAAAPSALGFGNVLVGQSQTQPVSITNTGTSSLSISTVSVSGTGFAVSGLTCPFTLSPGQSARLNVAFTPPAVGSDSGSVSVSASAQTWRHRRRRYAFTTATTTTTASVALTGSGIAAAGQIAASPASLSFGSLPAGGSQTLTETLNNSGTASVTVSQAAMSSGAFTVSGLSLPASLGAGQRLTFSVTFKPTASGSVSGNLAILSNASNPQLNIALSGSENTAGQLTPTPSALNFGSVTTGSKASLTGTLSATGSSVTISSATSTSAEFVLSGISFPVVLAAGQSVPFTVNFLPQTSGNAAASLAFVSNATNSPATESLSGVGLSLIQHSVNLAWSASTSAGVVGYNVYRAGVSGGPYTQLTSSLVPNPNYTDSAVAAGQTYFYVVTAEDGTGTESVHSNQVHAVVPTP